MVTLLAMALAIANVMACETTMAIAWRQQGCAGDSDCAGDGHGNALVGQGACGLDSRRCYAAAQRAYSLVVTRTNNHAVQRHGVMPSRNSGFRLESDRSGRNGSLKKNPLLMSKA